MAKMKKTKRMVNKEIRSMVKLLINDDSVRFERGNLELYDPSIIDHTEDGAPFLARRERRQFTMTVTGTIK